MSWRVTVFDERRADERSSFEKQMDDFAIQLENEWVRIRKHRYHKIRNEVSRGLREATDLLEYEYWKGWN